MVNKIDKKKQLLLILKENRFPVSGERLSQYLNISRVAVWKHVRSLEKAGYSIESSRKGYLLNPIKDLLIPWEIPDTGFRINHFREIDSTMETARKIAEAGCNEVVVSERQNRGRGRLKRKWNSPYGGLYFTIVLKSGIPAVYSYLYNFAAASVTAHILNEHFSIPATVKWPNDILVGDRKIAGVLLEIKGESSCLESLNIGIGINVNNIPEDKKACSMKLLKNREYARKDVLYYFLVFFRKMISDIFSANIVDFWKRYSSTQGKKVRITSIDKTITGTAVGIGSGGSLLIKEKSGEIIPAIFGDCHYL